MKNREGFQCTYAELCQTRTQSLFMCFGGERRLGVRLRRARGLMDLSVFEERGKPEYTEKNLLEQGREPTTNSTHIWRRRRDLNPDHIGGRQVLSPLRHPCAPKSYWLYRSHMRYRSQLIGSCCIRWHTKASTDSQSAEQCRELLGPFYVA